MNTTRLLASLLSVPGLFLSTAQAQEDAKSHPSKDIRDLSQHFIRPTGDVSPWSFVPEENIASLSTDEHPGMVTIWEAGRGQDIKGVLKEPIGIYDYPLPWEFHLGWIQKINISKVTENKVMIATVIICFRFLYPTNIIRANLQCLKLI